MKKKTLLFAICACATFVLATGCSSSNNQLTEALSPAVESTSASTETPAPTETPVPEPSVLSIGEKSSVGDWNIKVKKVSVKQKIQNGTYQYFKPGKGNSFLVVSLSVENKGKTDTQFLPRFGRKNTTTVVRLYYQNEYEYSATELMGYDKDLTTEYIQPLTKENGIIVFEVPKKTVKSKKDLTLNFSVGDESITYSLK